MSKVLYTHVTLTEKSRTLLLQWWEAKINKLLPDKICHHMTIKFKPTDDEVNTTALGKLVTLRVAGWGQNDKVQAVYVFSSVESSNPIAHITVAVDKEAGGKPKDSNEVLQSKITAIDGPKLEGIIEATLKDGRVVRELS